MPSGLVGTRAGCIVTMAAAARVPQAPHDTPGCVDPRTHLQVHAARTERRRGGEHAARGDPGAQHGQGGWQGEELTTNWLPAPTTPAPNSLPVEWLDGSPR
jgi:hypothetical protein